MVALFLFLKGMTGALAPFSYLVNKANSTKLQQLARKHSSLLQTYANHGS
jgi:hypothetical protein